MHYEETYFNGHFYISGTMMRDSVFFLLVVAAALQLVSFAQGYSLDHSSSKELEDQDDRSFHNGRRPMGPIRRLKERVSSVIRNVSPVGVSVEGSVYGNNPHPINSNYRPSTQASGYYGSTDQGSSAPCSDNNGCGELTIPVATGGLNPPPGFEPLQDVFVLDNFPNVIPFIDAPIFNSALPPLAPPQGSFGGSFGASVSGSFGSSQSIPPLSTASATPPRPSSVHSSQGSPTLSTFEPAPNQPPKIPSTNKHDASLGTSSFNVDKFGAVPQAQPATVPQNTQSSAFVENAILDVVNGIKDFTLDLLSTFRALGGPKNIVFSPVSIASLLSLLSLGAKGLSKQEIEIALNLPHSSSGVNGHEIYRYILKGANFYSEGVNITTSARIFLDQKIHIKQPFIEEAHRYYNCSVSLENFVSRPTQARRRINQWVKDQTNGKITNFVSSPLPSTTRMIVANTIYFSGAWKFPFPEFITSERDFNTGRKTIKVPMMTNVFEAPHYFSKTLNVDVVALPYVGGKYAMVIILPKEDPNQRSINNLEKELDSFYIEELLKNMTVKQVSVSLPRMKLSMKLQMKSNLEQLRISSIFDTFSSDFSNLSDDKPLFVNQMLHEAVMEVTEKGTVAAAASGVMLDRIGGFPRIMVNKPAILYIADYVNALPLFWARVVEPDPILN